MSIEIVVDEKIKINTRFYKSIITIINFYSVSVDL